MAARSTTPLAKAVDRKLYIAGMTRADLASELKVSNNYLSYLLTGRTRPSIEVSNRMAEILEMDGREIRELVLKRAM